MAGVGFALRALMRKDSLWAMFESQLHGVIAVAGPWFFTIVTMALPALMLDADTTGATLSNFITLLLYIFSLSLTLTSPIAITLTRHVSDRLYSRETETVAASFVGAVLLALVALLPIALLGASLLTLPLAPKAYALLACALVTINWIAAPMLSTFRQFRLLTLAYALGAGLFWWLLRGQAALDTAGLLMRFDLSMALTNAVLFGLVLRNFPGRSWPLMGVLGALRRYRVLAVGGLLYGAGIWVDKWLMWTVPEHLVSEAGLASYPTYDTVVFIAYVSTVPALALFVIKAETSLQESCERFYLAIQQHGRKAHLQGLRDDIVRVFLAAFRDVGLVQLSITALVVLLPVLALDLSGTPHFGVFMFRFCAIGAAFQLGVLLLSIVLFYFDSQRSVLFINGLFALSNLALTWLSMKGGLPWYGFGYFLASILSFTVAWWLVHRTLRDLLYLGFVAQNPSVTLAVPREPVPTEYRAARTAPGPLDRPGAQGGAT